MREATVSRILPSCKPHVLPLVAHSLQVFMQYIISQPLRAGTFHLTAFWQSSRHMCDSL